MLLAVKNCPNFSTLTILFVKLYVDASKFDLFTIIIKIPILILEADVVRTKISNSAADELKFV